MEAIQAHAMKMLAQCEVDFQALSPAGQGVFVLGGIAAAVLVVRTLLCASSWMLKQVSRKDPRSYGQWAVVTGATDGIGKAYAMELARRGMDVVLISRTKAKLDAVAEEISEAFGERETRVVVADFSKPRGGALYEEIARELKDLDIGVLVNNVGMSYPSALYFHELKDYGEHITDDLVELNVRATTRMTEMVLPGMVKRKRGFVVNISSANGHVPVGSPLYAAYSAGKAYVDFLGRSLSTELAGTGVEVQTQFPWFVVSKMSKLRKETFFTVSPEKYVKDAIATMGTTDSVVPVFSHWLQDAIMVNLPTPLLRMVTRSMHLSIRSRYLRKLERESKGN